MGSSDGKYSMSTSTLGDQTVRDNTLTDAEAIDTVIRTACAAGEAWRALGAADFSWQGLLPRRAGYLEGNPPGWVHALLGTHPTAMERIGQALAFRRSLEGAAAQPRAGS